MGRRARGPGSFGAKGPPSGDRVLDPVVKWAYPHPSREGPKRMGIWGMELRGL